MNAVAGNVPVGVRIFQRLGSTLFGLALALGILIVVWLVWALPDVVPFVPMVFIAGLGAWYLFQRPTLNLFVVLVSFLFVSDYAEGFSIQEILYGMYYMAFLGHWYFTRLFLYRENVFSRREERVLILFLILIVFTLPLTVFSDGSVKGYVSELLAFTFLAFYFPVKEAIERDPKAVRAILVALAVIGFYVLVRNVLKYQTIVSDAEYAFQVATGRAVTNEGLLLVPSVFALTFALFQKKWIPRLVFSGLFVMYFGGLILTQSRGYWIGFLVGAVAMLFIVPWRQKLTLTAMGVITGSGVLAVGLLLFGDVVLLLAYGILERILSIFTAGTRDISLINRFQETAGAWQMIKVNPILGYGMGVNYRVFDIIRDVTFVKSFVHNGYVALWFKFGLWGLGMMLFFLGSLIRRGYRSFKADRAELIYRLVGLGALACFAALFVSALTSNPFFRNDTTFIYGTLSGIIGGCYSRTRP